MRLATKLILLYFLLAVLPLSWITLYSYNSTIQVFRNAVEAESGTLAEEMGGRMDQLRQDLATRVARLESFPFRQLMALKDNTIDPQSNPLMAEFMAEIGDAAPMVDSIEFNPSVPAAPAVPPAESKAPKPPDKPEPPESTLRRLVIHLSPPEEAAAAAGGSGTAAPAQEGTVMHIQPGPPRAGHDPQHPPTPEEMQKLAARLEQIREFQVVLEKMGPKIEAQSLAAGAKAAAEAAREAASALPSMQQENPMGRNFGYVVRRDGKAIGTLQARVRSPEMFQSILSRARHHQEEIPFIIDADKKLHTVSGSDQKRIEALDLPAGLSQSGSQADLSQLKDWVVVTRKDQGSDLTFGIARPVSEPLREIRNTAVRNLGYGLAIVGLAVIAIVPLSGRMTRNLAALTRGAEALAGGDLNVRVPVRSHDEIGRLAESFNHMAHELSENQKSLVEQERLRKELEMSRRIQEELLPKRPLHAGPVEVKGVSIPAREVGGDFFNYFPVSDREIAILVGDVSGKGVAAALLMANLQATLQARLPLVQDLELLARQLDKEIAATTPQEVYLTLFIGILSPAEEELRYLNAGHNTQYAIHAEGALDLLESTGRPLGLLPGGDFIERSVRLGKGDALFLYTDGLVEAADDAGREFGAERLERILSEARAGSINEILARLEQEVRKHRGNLEAADDATMLVLKIDALP